MKPYRIVDETIHPRGIIYPNIVGFSPYKEEILLDPRVQTLMKKVKVYVHPDLTQEKPDAIFTHYIKVKIKDGRDFSFKKAVVGGYTEKPLSQEEVLGKYRDCAKKVLSASEIEHSIKIINGLENLEDIGSLVRVLGTEVRS